jgi:uncharacterized protein (TIGR02266 family)
MPNERRRGPRTAVDGARVTCAGASGERVRGRGLDVGEGGIFVQVDKVLDVGEWLSLEVQLAEASAPWAAGGRVIWVRELAGKDGKPRGMGVAFVDLHDAARAAIRRVLARDTAAGPGEGFAAMPPSRERTVLGVGLATPHHAVAASPVVALAPPRERTVLGVAPVAAPQARTKSAPVADELPDWSDEPPAPEKAAAPAAEQSVPIELTAARARVLPRAGWGIFSVARGRARTFHQPPGRRAEEGPSDALCSLSASLGHGRRCWVPRACPASHVALALRGPGGGAAPAALAFDSAVRGWP